MSLGERPLGGVGLLAPVCSQGSPSPMGQGDVTLCSGGAWQVVFSTFFPGLSATDRFGEALPECSASSSYHGPLFRFGPTLLTTGSSGTTHLLPK